jgi:hypothetical protein
MKIWWLMRRKQVSSINVNMFDLFFSSVTFVRILGDIMAIRDAATALEILDIDGDGKIGLLDFIHFARRLKKIHQGTR